MMVGDKVTRYKATFSEVRYGIAKEDNQVISFDVFFHPDSIKMQDHVIYRKGGAVKFRDATEQEQDQTALKIARDFFEAEHRRTGQLKMVSFIKQVMVVEDEKELL